MKVEKYLGWVVVAAVLGACNGVTEPELPADRPFGSVSGYVVDEPINGATISVYAFDEGRQGELLATSSVTTTDGAYSLQLQSKDRPVLIEARGGAFTDLVSGTHIEVDSDQVLRAVKMYRSGEPLSLMVTPLTHIAAGLAEYKATHGVSANDAVTQANAEISKLFQLDVTGTRPFSINDPAAADRDGQFYGFYLAAMSSWANWATQHGGATPNASFSTLELTQIIYNDIHADGKLDGVGLNPVDGQPMSLAFANQPLGPSVYRRDFSQHMITLAVSGRNASGVTVDALLPRAQALQNDDNSLVPVVSSGSGLSLTSALEEGKYYNGVLKVSVTPSETIVLKQVQFYLDGNDIGYAADKDQPAINIGTGNYNDGAHSITAKATDMLGNSFERTFNVNFDNSGPRINVPSKFLTKTTLFTLSGTYIENGASVSKILVNGQEAKIIDGANWQVLVNLSEGLNAFDLKIIDVLGNQTTSQTVVALDLRSPVFDTSAGHSAVRLSDGNGEYTNDALADTNATPLFLETDKVDLNGVLVTRINLQNKMIPYFAVKVNDPVFSKVGSSPDKITVSLRIEKSVGGQGPQPITAWLPLTMVNGEYLLPLATERLFPDWIKSTHNDVIGLRVRAVDEALNESYKVFTFKPDFVVPPLGTVQTADISWPLFDGIQNTFVRRAELHGQSFPALKYSFSNSTGHDFFVSFKSGSASVDREVSEVIRKHSVTRKSGEFWRAGFYDLSQYQCPPVPPVMGNVTVIYNYSAGAWHLETLPGAKEETVSITQDDLPVMDFGTWSVPSDADVFVDDQPGVSHVEYDYSISPPDQNGNVASVAWVKSWQFPNANPPQSCDGASLFQKKTEISYTELSGPVNEVTAIQPPEITPFAADSFKVHDNVTENDIPQFNGRYRIPAGHNITVERTVTTPTVTVAPIDAALDGVGGGYDGPHLFDQTVTWSIQRPLVIQVIHDAGDININSMTVRNNVVGSGTKTYQLSR